jgi:hypothetical protein
VTHHVVTETVGGKAPGILEQAFLSVLPPKGKTSETHWIGEWVKPESKHGETYVTPIPGIDASLSSRR